MEELKGTIFCCVRFFVEENATIVLFFTSEVFSLRRQIFHVKENQT